MLSTSYASSPTDRQIDLTPPPVSTLDLPPIARRTLFLPIKTAAVTTFYLTDYEIARRVAAHVCWPAAARTGKRVIIEGCPGPTYLSRALLHSIDDDRDASVLALVCRPQFLPFAEELNELDKRFDYAYPYAFARGSTLLSTTVVGATTKEHRRRRFSSALVEREQPFPTSSTYTPKRLRGYSLLKRFYQTSDLDLVVFQILPGAVGRATLSLKHIVKAVIDNDEFSRLVNGRGVAAGQRAYMRGEFPEPVPYRGAPLPGWGQLGKF